MKAVIMAGGKGTRISSMFPNIPKPLIPIDGVPVLERQLRSLASQGVHDIIITVGYLYEQIINYFGDGSGVSPITGNHFETHISYFIEDEPLGTAGALFKIKDILSDDFFLLNADSVFDIDLSRFFKAHINYGGLATILAHSNRHPFDSGLLIIDDNHSIVKWINKEEKRPLWYFNTVNSGLHILKKSLIDKIQFTKTVDLDRDILRPLAGTGQMFAYRSSEYIEDMGTPERYNIVQMSLKKGIVHLKNLKYKQKAIFLDRDGTINKYVGYLTNLDDFKILPRVAEAIRKINLSEYLAIVVTNQPVVARGEITFDQLDLIHKKMETLLGNENAYLDRIYYCPHHPDKGFKGEIAELKIECDCRKPKLGMLLEAQRDFNIDFSSSWVIGDDARDIEMGIKAGCHTVLIGDKNYGQDITSSSLIQAIDTIFDGI